MYVPSIAGSINYFGTPKGVAACEQRRRSGDVWDAGCGRVDSSPDHYYSSESAFSAALESALVIAPIILRKTLFWKGMA